MKGTSLKNKAAIQAEGMIMAQAVVAPLYYYTTPYMLNEQVGGLYYSPLGLFFFSYCQPK